MATVDESVYKYLNNIRKNIHNYGKKRSGF